MRTLRSSGRVDAAEIAAELRVTNETVRKDLIQLERQGLLRRVHGGAVPIEQLSYEPDVAARTEFADAKQRIAMAAFAHLPADGGSVLLDAGSTTSRLADIFPSDRSLIVFTNTLPIALTLLARPNLTVHTIGGRLRGPTSAEVGPWADRTLRELNVDVAFLGTNGISLDRGLTTPDPAEAATKRLMLSSARQRILLADHSKVGLVSLCKHGELSDVDLLITDSDLPDDQRVALAAAGLAHRVRMIRAPLVVTVTPNPSVDWTLEIPTLVRGAVHRITGQHQEPSGKGVNVTRALTEQRGRLACGAVRRRHRRGRSSSSCCKPSTLPMPRSRVAGLRAREHLVDGARRDRHQDQRDRADAARLGGGANCCPQPSRQAMVPTGSSDRAACRGG